MTDPRLRLLGALPDAPETLRRLFEQSDPGPLIQAAARHGLGAVLAEQIDRAGVPLTAEHSMALEQARRQVAASVLKVRPVLQRALEALGGAGITPVLLKGYGLAARLYPDPLLRPMSDVDLLVGTKELAAAEAALEAQGLRRGEPHAEAWARRHHHHLLFWDRGTAVELHFRALSGFGTELPADALVDRSVPGRLEGRAVRYLQPEDEVVYLAGHAAEHQLQRLGWLYDLKLLVATTPLDWDEIAGRAREAALQTPVYLSLWAAQQTLGGLVPEAALAALAPWPGQRALLQTLFAPERLVARGVPLSRGWLYAVAPLMASGAGGALRYLGHHGWHALRRRLSRMAPALTPAAWRG